MVAFIVNHSDGRTVGFKDGAQERACCLEASARDSTQEDEVHSFGESAITWKDLRGRICSDFPTAYFSFLSGRS